MPARTYWQDNLRLVALCLVVWFVVSFGFGILGLDVLNREGAAVPVLVQQGDWHRLVLDPFLHTSLLGILFSIWVWLSLGGMLVALAGGGRAFIVFLVGGAAGALAHAVQHPELLLQEPNRVAVAGALARPIDLGRQRAPLVRDDRLEQPRVNLVNLLPVTELRAHDVELTPQLGQRRG